LILTILGLAAFGMAWMPLITKKLKISYSVIYVALGALTYTFIDTLPDPNPTRENLITLRLTELVVIISLMGVGLKIDQRFSFKTWAIPLRLVSVTMLLSIAATVALAHFWLGFNIASAMLLGAALAPTDPVLASDVQVGPPLENDRSNVRFSLTAEGGLNDGMAFPFTWLAIILATTGIESSMDMGSWFLRDVVYKLAAGVICGILLGRLLAYLVFTIPEKTNFIVIKDGFVAVATTLMVYGITEMVHGYGFIAVFVTAITMRNQELDHKYHKKLHDFTDQIERILVSIVLIAFGGSLVHGILMPLSWPMVALGVVFILAIRPISALVGMIGTKLKKKERLVIAFFGIRGIGSFYYLAFAAGQVQFKMEKELWTVVSFIVVLSLLIHGLTATATFEKMEKEAEKAIKGK